MTDTEPLEAIADRVSELGKQVNESLERHTAEIKKHPSTAPQQIGSCALEVSVATFQATELLLDLIAQLGADLESAGTIRAPADEALRRVEAEAWQEGFYEGERYGRAATFYAGPENPYRAALEEGLS